MEENLRNYLVHLPIWGRLTLTNTRQVHYYSEKLFLWLADVRGQSLLLCPDMLVPRTFLP